METFSVSVKESVCKGVRTKLNADSRVPRNLNNITIEVATKGFVRSSYVPQN